MKAYPEPRLVYPKGRIRMLNMQDKIEAAELYSNCTLVLYGISSFCWDVSHCDRALKVRKIQ